MRCTVLAGVVSCVLLSAGVAGPAHASIRQPTDIPAESLDLALRTLAKDRHLQVLYRTELVQEVRTPGASGSLTPDEALTKLLSGTGLSYKYLDANTVTVISPTASQAAAAGGSGSNLASGGETKSDNGGGKEASRDFRVAQLAQANPGPQVANDQEPTNKKKDEALNEIVVTGTLIHGVEPAGSPLKVYTRDDIDKSGAATIDQFARQMVENFSGVDTVSNVSSNSGFARFNDSANNSFAGAAFDLHGIGPSATLTLLNGHRLAHAGGDGSITDMSLIPLSAIDHIEVLFDGASAIYGADAVAGVVNIITRQDFEGAETSLRYGEATDGGAIERSASQLIGHSWGTGNAMLSYEFNGQGGLDAAKRDYVGEQGGPFSLIPENRRNSVFLSASQNLGEGTTFSGTALYSDRKFSTYLTDSGSYYTLSENVSGAAKQSGLTFDIDQKLPGNWDLDGGGNYSKVRQDSISPATIGQGTSASTSVSALTFNDETYGVSLLASGPLFSTSAGEVKAAIGSSFRKESFNTTFSYTSEGTPVPVMQTPGLERNVWSIFGEAFVPLVSEANAVALMRRLELSVALRRDHYSDFGSSTNPKLGVLWQPVSAVSVRGTWGKSFQAPLLAQLAGPVLGETLPVPDTTAPSDVTDTLIVAGGNPNLRPETSNSFTAGFDFKPETLPQFKLGATYFHIAFRGRIAIPPVIGQNYLTDPALDSFVTRNPPLSQVEAYLSNPAFSDYAGGGAAAVGAIFDSRFTNIASTVSSGVDLTASYLLTTSTGDFTFTGSVNRLLKNDFQPDPGAPALALLNTFGEPTKWKGRGGVAWQRGGFSISAITNVVSSYQNTLTTPSQKIGSWITEDLSAAFRTGTTESYGMRNLAVSLNVRNITDRRPPYVLIPIDSLIQPGQNPIPFDAANASPVGRLISLGITKRW